MEDITPYISLEGQVEKKEGTSSQKLPIDKGIMFHLGKCVPFCLPKAGIIEVRWLYWEAMGKYLSYKLRKVLNLGLYPVGG